MLNLGACAVDLQCDEVCLEDPEAQYTCTADIDLLTWLVPNPMNSEDIDMLQIHQNTNSLPDDTNTFTAVVSNSNPLVSTLSFVATTELDNLEIKCDDIKCTIMILGM